LIVPGLRAGHYLCFFGMHVLTPALMSILADEVAKRGEKGGVPLTGALANLAARERYLACELEGRRYDIGVKYGLLTAQLAIALAGEDRDEVLCGLVELLASRGKLAADLSISSPPPNRLSAIKRSTRFARNFHCTHC